MRIILIGDPFGLADTGEKNVVRSVYDILCSTYDVIVFKPSEILKYSRIRQMRAFRPDIVHYWAGPRFRSFVLLWLFRVFSSAQVSCMTAIRPQLSRLSLFFSGMFKPEIILAQSDFYLRVFSSAGFNAIFFANGINTEKFSPVSLTEKLRLRDKYGIPGDKFTVLHVGHITGWRSLEVFADIAKLPGFQVVIIASSVFPPDESLFRFLDDSGCIIIDRFLPEIQEFYQLSDCYVFPGGTNLYSMPFFFAQDKVVPSIDIPLSVLEAMATNLFIVTSTFGGLKNLFNNTGSFRFASSRDDFAMECISLKNSGLESRTRQQVSALDWKEIKSQLDQIYMKFINVDAKP